MFTDILAYAFVWWWNWKQPHGYRLSRGTPDQRLFLFLNQMNIHETLKGVQREAEAAKAAVVAAERRCQEMLWGMERDGLSGQERMDAEKALKVTQMLKSADKVIAASLLS